MDETQKKQEDVRMCCHVPVIEIDNVLYPATWDDDKGWHVAEEDLE